MIAKTRVGPVRLGCMKGFAVTMLYGSNRPTADY
jgi:hypothetical protein